MREVTCDVAVIGAGTAGLHAYKVAVYHGADAVIIERGQGGSTCTRVGCMPSKALIAAGRAAMQARRAGLFGIDVAGVSVDGPAVMRRVREERDYFTDGVLKEYHAIPADRRLHGDGRFLGPGRLAVGDDLIVTARSIVIATGSHPAVPPALEPVRDLVHTNETIFELADLPATLAVIGAGPLGLELAQAFARLGVAVTVFDQGHEVGRIADPPAERAAREALSREFAIHLGVEVSAERAGDKARLSWTGGEVVVDLVLAATGRPPNLEGLNLEAAQLPLDDKGVPRFGEVMRRVGDTQVFIAGDAGAWRPVLHEASRGGRIAGHAAAEGASCSPIPALAIAFTEPAIVEVGTRFDALPAGARIGEARVSDNGRARIDGDAAGLVRLYADSAGRVIGGTIVATGGEHPGQALTMAIQCGVEAATLADMAWYHPTIEELLQEAARAI
jgi:dihydrolipoamide dehydrogenase